MADRLSIAPFPLFWHHQCWDSRKYSAVVRRPKVLSLNCNLVQLPMEISTQASRDALDIFVSPPPDCLCLDLSLDVPHCVVGISRGNGCRNFAKDTLTTLSVACVCGTQMSRFLFCACLLHMSCPSHWLTQIGCDNHCLTRDRLVTATTTSQSPQTAAVLSHQRADFPTVSTQVHTRTIQRFSFCGLWFSRPHFIIPFKKDFEGAITLPPE